MKDIVEIEDGFDLGLADTVVAKAGNVLSIQLGSLEYALDFGVDLTFFLQSDFRFQNESFKAYLVQRLTESQINVSDVLTTIQTFAETYAFYVGDTVNQPQGLIR